MLPALFAPLHSIFGAAGRISGQSTHGPAATAGYLKCSACSFTWL